jgi:alkylation response protein AidB-like acyl-CoA dehydrogenase
VVRDNPRERHESGLLYCVPTGSFFSSGFAGVAMGLARTMLEAFVALARDKTPRGYAHTLRQSGVVQSQVAQCEARLRSSRVYLLTTLGDIWEAAGGAGDVTLEQRMAIRLASTHAMQQAKEVVDTVYHAAGATAIFRTGAFERRFRDMHAITQQMQGRIAHFETVGHGCSAVARALRSPRAHSSSSKSVGPATGVASASSARRTRRSRQARSSASGRSGRPHG